MEDFHLVTRPSEIAQVTATTGPRPHLRRLRGRHHHLPRFFLRRGKREKTEAVLRGASARAAKQPRSKELTWGQKAPTSGAGQEV